MHKTPANSNKKPIKAGVIGYPIEHSLSPVIHRYWLDHYGITGTYDAIKVAPEELGDFLKDLPKNGFAGINVTLPHKEEAIPFMQPLETVEQVIGAINTVWVHPETGLLYGSNSDYYGFFKNLKQHAPDAVFLGKRAVVLGAGGACRAVIAALIALMGMYEVVLVNRTRETAEEKAKLLMDAFGGAGKKALITVEDWDDRDEVLKGASLLVNTTSLGMEGQPELEIDLAKLPKDALVTDIVYTPLMTDLLCQAEERGNPIVDGLGMLLHQAVLGFYKWYGVEPEVTPELRQHVLDCLKTDCV